MQLVQTITVGAGGAASIEFTGIPQSGKDLLCVFSFRHNNASGDVVDMRVNGNSSAIYSKRTLRARTATPQSFSDTGASQISINHGTTNTSMTASTFSSSSIYISNYTSSAAKSVSSESAQENSSGTDNTWGLAIHAALANTTSPITSLSLNSGASLLQNSTASLYIIS